MPYEKLQIGGAQKEILSWANHEFSIEEQAMLRNVSRLPCLFKHVALMPFTPEQLLVASFGALRDGVRNIEAGFTDLETIQKDPVQRPLALEPGSALSNTTGAVLDPIFALRTRVRLEPGQYTEPEFVLTLRPKYPIMMRPASRTWARKLSTWAG